MQSLTSEVRQQLLKFPVGTIVESQSGEAIGHVVGYHMHETKDYWEAMVKERTDIRRRTYQLRILWASESGSHFDISAQESIVDFNDVRTLT